MFEVLLKPDTTAAYRIDPFGENCPLPMPEAASILDVLQTEARGIQLQGDK